MAASYTPSAGPLGLRGKINGERRAFAEYAGHLDFAAGLLGKSERLAKAQPCPLADTLGGEEGFKDGVELVGGDA